MAGKFDFDTAKKDKMLTRRKARKIKQVQQDESFAPDSEQAYSSGGTVRGMGAAKRGGKYCLA